MRRELKWKWTYYFVGLAIMSLGISMIIQGNSLGVSPWDVLHIGLFKKLGLTIGSWTIITGLLIIITTSLYLKQWPKLATWFNMLFVGLFIDFFNWILPDSTMLAFDIIYFLMGIVVMSVGCAMYISPKLGAGPRDSIMMIIVEKFGGSIKLARFIMETFAVITGWLLGGPVGVGTVIIALFSGYVIQPALPFFEKRLAKRIAHPTTENVLPKQTEALAKES